VLDDLKGYVDARGFEDRFHEGIVSLMILIVNPHRPLHALLSAVSQNKPIAFPVR
jgi:hypothetical protein